MTSHNLGVGKGLFSSCLKSKVSSPDSLNLDEQMVTHLKQLPLRDCFPPRNEQAHKFEGHFCAGSGRDEDDGRADGVVAFADTCRGDSGGPVTTRYTRFDREQIQIDPVFR